MVAAHITLMSCKTMNTLYALLLKIVYCIQTDLVGIYTYTIQCCTDGQEYLFVLTFYSPVNPMGSCRARSVYL